MFDQMVEAVQQAVETALANVNTGMPGTIVSYNAATNRAVVKPDLPKATAVGEALDSSNIVEVPVVWNASNDGKASFTMPLQPGDRAWLTFSQRSLENWLDGKMTMPDDPRQFDLTDCVAIPGCAPGGIVAHDQDVVLKFNNAEVRIKPDNTVSFGNSSASITIDPNGNITLKGASVKIDTPGLKFALETHRHQSTGAGAITTPPLPS